MPDLKKMLTLEALSEALPSWLKRSTKPEYNADEIDSTNTINQFVSDSDKDNWNAKGTYSKPSGGIPKSDLSSIVQTSLEKADSALQSETDPTVPSWAKQSSKPSYTQDEVPDGSTYKRVSQTEKDAWSGKQNALSTTQMQAVNSGIDSTKVGKIADNTSNIVLLESMNGAKNLFNETIEFDSSLISGLTAVVQSDNSIRITGAPTQRSNITFIFVHKPASYFRKYNDYYLYGSVLRGSNIASSTFAIELLSSPYTSFGASYNGNLSAQPINAPNSNGEAGMYVRVQCESIGVPIDVTFKPMIISAEMAEAGFLDYKPYALSNTTITPALIEQVDNGAKNLFEIDAANVVRSTESNYSVTGSTFQMTASKDWSYTSFIIKGNLDTTKTYVLSFRITAESHTSGSTESEIRICPTDSGGNPIINPHITGTGTYAIVFKPTLSTMYLTMYANPSGNSSLTNSFTVTDVMICTEADWKVSQKYVPHSMSYQGLSDKKLDRLRSASDGGLISSGDLNSITVNSFALYTNAVSNLPETAAGSGYCFVRTSIFDSNAALQEAIMLQTGSMYTRTKYANTWGEWKKATNS